MEALILARIQFASTTIFHFFFVPLTLGMAILVAVMETRYVQTGDETYKRMTKFWGKLFLINFAIGVVTGIVQEFQFGMNWSEYSRYVGDIFGVPLAIEALLAFFLESTFIGVWIFGWDKLSKKAHAATIWLVAIGSNLSALWILIANSWMQMPVGYVEEGGRALLTSFSAILFNPHVWVQFPHVLSAGLAMGGFFIMGIAAWHILRGNDLEFYKKSIRSVALITFLASLMLPVIGHFQGKIIAKHQPMKIAAAEAHWETEDPASWSLFAFIDQEKKNNPVDIKIPGVLSFMIYDEFKGKVEGLNDLQEQYEKKYSAKHGSQSFIPPVAITYWSFRLMVGIGMLMLLVSFIAWFTSRKDGLFSNKLLLRLMMFMIPLPYIGNTTGWIVTEVGRWPWIAQGLLTLDKAVSPNVSAGAVLFTLIGYVAIYGTAMVFFAWLVLKYAGKGPQEA